MSIRRLHRPARAERGFSMLEVLIALLVLAFGMLGYALLQTLTLRYTQSADYRTQATNLAYDMLDQMRANRLSAASYAAASFNRGTITDHRCEAVTTLNQVTVANNIARWQCHVVKALGADSRAEVTFANGVATVTLQWGERVPTGADDTTTFQVRTQL